MSQLFLIAQVADRTVAISTDQVDSVVDLAEVVPVPGAVSQVRGLAALRSRVVTVICSRRALGAAPSSANHCRAVITAIEGQHYAILVDALEDVAPFVAESLSPGLVLDGGWRGAASGLIDCGGEPVLAIRLAALVPALAAAA